MSGVTPTASVAPPPSGKPPNGTPSGRPMPSFTDHFSVCGSRLHEMGPGHATTGEIMPRAGQRGPDVGAGIAATDAPGYGGVYAEIGSNVSTSGSRD
ncbi:hypothetical protein TSOC_001374 [Tetrabaena socialis]|uniref:Uncharacterized protein n=1 Tax=Tetrabaena socialis TaxID=47790 RepID=A0A2J8AGZ2_9CHLO|nr:hypothetical protein TSOC_001374 [Tetrabaena socialis]|eukprot:PNH11789.1 hypothetical protein TSOC_001374 [Tetrabaena socialis]